MQHALKTNRCKNTRQFERTQNIYNNKNFIAVLTLSYIIECIRQIGYYCGLS